MRFQDVDSLGCHDGCQGWAIARQLHRWKRTSNRDKVKHERFSGSVSSSAWNGDGADAVLKAGLHQPFAARAAVRRKGTINSQFESGLPTESSSYSAAVQSHPPISIGTRIEAGSKSDWNYDLAAAL